jgi:hypothetical protein
VASQRGLPRIRDWTNRDRYKYRESVIGLEHAEGFLQGVSARRCRKILKLNRNQLQLVTGLFTGQCHLTGHVFKLGLTNNPAYERYMEKDEAVTHIL